ncbi:IucA/IucC family protein [Paenibacillus farraposensis]|uniref:IucA/IucC family protein n=1 Tax=Paenibacillus farraposensis TaxID=2807095 RepID=UPI003614034C
MLIQSMETFAAAKERPQSRIWAEQATLRALVNSYLRETRQFDPRFDPRIDGQAQEMRVILPQLGRQIGGTLDHFSVTGQHVYGNDWYEVEEEGDRRWLGIEEVMQRLLDELGHRANPEQREVEQQNMKQRIHNSLHKMTLFMDRHLKLASGSTSTGSSQEVHLMYVDSEQSLLMGHPFHPYPKSTEGFMEDELPLYSPEMSAVFQLFYFAVHQDHVQEEWLGEQHRRDAIDPSVRLRAQRQWGEELEHFCICPCIPAAEHVLHQPHIQSLILERRLIPMGVLWGLLFYPTSSIRTVWNVETGNGYMLPLHVRITNLVRDNTQEQARRTLMPPRLSIILQANGHPMSNLTP